MVRSLLSTAGIESMQRYTNLARARSTECRRESARARLSSARAISRQRASSSSPTSLPRVARLAYLMNLGLVPYGEALSPAVGCRCGLARRGAGDRDLPRAPAGRDDRAATETDVELHVPDSAAVEIAERTEAASPRSTARASSSVTQFSISATTERT